MHKLKEIKEQLECAVEEEVRCLEKANTKELGEVIDMIKDIEAAMYYHAAKDVLMHDGEPFIATTKEMPKIENIDIIISKMTDYAKQMLKNATLEQKTMVQNKIVAMANKIVI